MPIYAYQCDSCGNQFDLKQGFDASVEQPCPECKSTARRLFSAPTVIYKGSGFYTTDYARKGNGSASSSSSSSSSDSKAESKAESKDTASTMSDSPSSDSKKAEPKSKASSETT